MIHIVNGNLLQSDCNIIIQQSNCFANVNAGIAKQIATKYPITLKADEQYHIPVKDRRRLGGFSSAKVAENQIYINMYSQFSPRSQTDYKAFEKSLNNILTCLNNKKMKNVKIGMPYKIGCGLGGGNWNHIKKLVEKISSEQNLDVYFYKLN